MDYFLYKDGILHAEDVPVPQIAAEVGTPFYLYSAATLLAGCHFLNNSVLARGLQNNTQFVVARLQRVANVCRVRWYQRTALAYTRA